MHASPNKTKSLVPKAIRSAHRRVKLRKTLQQIGQASYEQHENDEILDECDTAS
jgi:hypothetical protein